MKLNKVTFSDPPNTYAIIADEYDGGLLWDIHLVGVNPNSGHEDYLETLATNIVEEEKESLLSLFAKLTNNK